ncbi:hypothetical protein CFP65_0041 [Kitasatospora sp. MMS16-BH015]|uniref:DUF1330 domain-containing protein n=1 Tax=Kitasatospora sp. MMS16-BH015 TaxID=2018025 RepID=UPI000CA17F79|nr:DUF1330 domain-containing protein [Kitasatospora sp. MMS16-BH015]AUG75027.1 hypothetical protein CFP65_0041 [Kitasatospora sp. MMS16-BH015]
MHYVIFTRTDQTPDAELGHYLANVGATLDPFYGRLLTFGEPERLEGETRYTRTALLEFPTEDDARAWYRSPAYQELVHWRTQALGHSVDINLLTGAAA